MELTSGPSPETDAARGGGLDRLDARDRKAVARFKPGASLLYRFIAQSVLVTSRLVMQGLNRVEIEGQERFDALQDRGGRGLLTLSNHVALYDDPLLLACFARLPYHRQRWVAADATNFFGNAFKGVFFSGGRVVPVVRGGGFDQLGFRFLGERLLAGDWVHVFPEGGRTRDPEARLRRPFKNGIGRLIADTRPLVLPFYHHGMHGILPIGAALPRVRKRVLLRFGEATDCSTAWMTAHAQSSGVALWDAVTSEFEAQLAALEHAMR